MFREEYGLIVVKHDYTENDQKYFFISATTYQKDDSEYELFARLLRESCDYSDTTASAKADSVAVAENDIKSNAENIFSEYVHKTLTKDEFSSFLDLLFSIENYEKFSVRAQQMFNRVGLVNLDKIIEIQMISANQKSQRLLQWLADCKLPDETSEDPSPNTLSFSKSC